MGLSSTAAAALRVMNEINELVMALTVQPQLVLT